MNVKATGTALSIPLSIAGMLAGLLASADPPTFGPIAKVIGIALLVLCGLLTVYLYSLIIAASGRNQLSTSRLRQVNWFGSRGYSGRRMAMFYTSALAIAVIADRAPESKDWWQWPFLGAVMLQMLGLFMTRKWFRDEL
ncbi:hypothetical protein [Novosphingobium colocasiae]|uniref:hypothetical protein n=1 Tax=Novosphingobium colocasiae TaxID=1256513 RepID=UPI0035B3089C